MRCDVALMVLNWNGADLLRRHLPTVLEAARRAPLDARVYVIDNASTDNSLAVLDEFADVEVLRFTDNRRLHAYNDAAQMVDCEAFMMLNNDLSPAPDVVAPLWETLSSRKDVFAVGGEVLDVASGELDSGPTGMRWESQWVLDATGLAGSQEPIPVAYCSGGAALYRRRMFLELGGFWDALPGLYWEDVELGLRAWLHGWRSVFRPDVRFDHDSGSTVRRSLNPRVREFLTYQNVRLTHLGCTLDRRDLTDYLLGELRRAGRKPYLVATAMTLVPFLPAVARQRRALRNSCGAVPVARLERQWAGTR